MNLTEYNAMPDGDTKLAVRLAVTMGWEPGYFWRFDNGFMVSQIAFKGKKQRWWRAVFNPFTDASIPYGLIGYGLVEEIGHEDELCYAEVFVQSEDSAGQRWVKRVEEVSESKTHAILNAYCQSDPMGHWAKFIGEKS